MIFGNKNKFRPLYKQFIQLKENVQNRKKLLNFKKQKWEKFIQNYKKKLKWYKKFKPIDQTQYLVSRYPSKKFSYKKRYKNTLQDTKKIRLLYGNLAKNSIKKLIKITLKKKYRKINPLFLELFESRLDTVLYRAKFSTSVRNATQLIIHNKILVNNKLVKTKSYLLKPGDLISVDPKYFKLIDTNVQQANLWPIPPKYLTVNYRTLQIVFGTFKNTNLSMNFSFHLNLEKILTGYYQH
jgi:small subunit ribosomal protein S4